VGSWIGDFRSWPISAKSLDVTEVWNWAETSRGRRTTSWILTLTKRNAARLWILERRFDPNRVFASIVPLPEKQTDPVTFETRFA
jgi:hypothetical protein